MLKHVVEGQVLELIIVAMDVVVGVFEGRLNDKGGGVSGL